MQKRAVGLLAASGHLLPEAFDHVAVILHHHVSEHTVGLRAVALFPEIRLEKKEFLITEKSSRGRLVQWKNTRFVKIFVQKGPRFDPSRRKLLFRSRNATYI